MVSKDEFHLEEYKCLRAEINNSIEKIFWMVKFVPVASAAMLAWLATNATRSLNEKICLSIPSNALDLLWAVPAILGVMGFLFSLFQMHHIFKIGDYLRFLEERYGYDDPEFGWERRLNRRGKGALAGVLSIWVVFIGGCCFYAVELHKIFGLFPACL